MRKGREAGGTNGPRYIDTFVSARRQIDAIARKRGSLPVAAQKKSVGRARQKWLSLPRVEENLRVYTGVIICAYLGT